MPITGTGQGPAAGQFGYGVPNSNTGATAGMAGTDWFDNRHALTSTDSTALTLIPATAITSPNEVWDIDLTIHGYSGTVSSGKYVMGWTSNAATQTATVSITGVTQNAPLAVPCLPDMNTAVTVQLTTLTGTSPSVSVSAIATRCL